MARVKTFILHEVKGVHDKEVAEFITDCEEEFYVNVAMVYIPFPTARVTVIVTKIDNKEE